MYPPVSKVTKNVVFEEISTPTFEFFSRAQNKKNRQSYDHVPKTFQILAPPPLQWCIYMSVGQGGYLRGYLLFLAKCWPWWGHISGTIKSFDLKFRNFGKLCQKHKNKMEKLEKNLKNIFSTADTMCFQKNSIFQKFWRNIAITFFERIFSNILLQKNERGCSQLSIKHIFFQFLSIFPRLMTFLANDPKNG